MNAKAEQLSATVISQMSGAVQMSKDSTSTMLGISDTNPDFSDDQRGLFMTANGAVGSANNAVYAVESLDARFRAAGADCRRLSSRLVSALQFCAAGNGYDADVEIINRSRIELGGAIEEFGKAADSWPQAVAAVNDAQRAAADTMTYMQLMAKQPDNEDYPRLVKQATDRTKQLAKVADGAVGKAKNATRRAEARALLARINLAVLGQRPEMRQVADGMVAHYTLSRPEQVAKLRELGFGHGDAAFALAASKVTGADATSYISTPPASSLISSLQTEGVRMDGATVLLRYLANALEHEMELAEKAG